MNMEDAQKPRLLIVVTEGPLMMGAPVSLGGRPTTNISVASPPIPPAAIAVSVTTGVNALVHNVVTRATVDSRTYEIREACREDRRAQAFWDGTDLSVKTVNWPATIGDVRVDNIDTVDCFGAIRKCLNADVVCALLPWSANQGNAIEQVRLQQEQLEDLISSLPDSHIILIHRRTEQDGSLKSRIRPYEATLITGQDGHAIKNIPYLELIGGVAYLFAGVPCPVGVKQPEWTFLDSLNVNAPRAFPTVSDIEDTDWFDVIEHVLKEDNKQAAKLLSMRFLAVSMLAFKKEKWEQLEFSSASLIHLRGNPYEYWMLVIALEQQAKFEQLGATVKQLTEVYPHANVTKIAELFVQLQDETLIEKLEQIKVDQISIPQALGAFGRLCLKTGLDELGTQAIMLAIKHGFATSSDRAQLANHFFKVENYESGLRALREVGANRGEMTWQVLRLKLLVALEKGNEATQLANVILEQDSTQENALAALKKFA